MGQISLTLPSDGTTIEAADVNNPFNALLNEFNGNIDNDNIKSGAGISGTKLLANSLPPTSYDANARAGWNTGILPAPNTITALGNKSYSLVFNSTDLTSYISKGMRLRTTRTTAAPNQCTSLNGSTQYYNKTSPAGMTFTDDFTISAWIKVNSFNATTTTIASRYNGTSGWVCQLNSNGQLQLIGFNAGAANFSQISSNQSVPLGKWIHIAAQLDMSAFTATPTTSYVMLDGVDVSAAVSRGGTNPTALIQAGNLEIGGYNGGTQPFNGKIAQLAIYNSKITEATILTTMAQTLSGSETSLISAYSFSNTINDLNVSNANNLTAQASAVATNADSPYGTQADTTISTTLDYAIVTNTSFSTNTTLTVQAPEGCTIPTSGGLSAIAYSIQKVPYGFPAQRGKWRVEALLGSDQQQTSATSATWYNIGSFQLTIPVGDWIYGFECSVSPTNSTNNPAQFTTLSTANNSEVDKQLSADMCFTTTSNTTVGGTGKRERDLTLTAATLYYLNHRANTGTNTTTLRVLGASEAITKIYADCAYL